MALHHIALGARDVERVSVFYRDVFELPELRRQARADGSLRSVWLDLGGAILMIEQVPAADVAGGVPREHGAFLLAFGVSPADRMSMEQRLERFGASIEARSEFTSYARDPENNRVAVSHYPAAREV